MSSFLVYVNENVSGPVDMFHAKGTVVSTTSKLRFERDILHAPSIEADQVISRSDLNFKENISNLSECLSKLLKLQSKLYNYKNDIEKSQHNGYIAQDVQEIFPNLVHVDPVSGNLFVNYIEIIPIITESIKELFDIVQKLQEKIN
jgi:hypothetical protein